MTALAIIGFLVLLMIVFIAKGCSKSGDEKGGSKKEKVTTAATTAVTTTVEITTVPTTTVNPLAAAVQLSKREMFIDIGNSDMSIISVYPEGSGEVNEVWTSMDESIATVDSIGNVTGVSQGETFIILSFNNNPGVEIEIKVHVADTSGAVNPGITPDITTADTSFAPTGTEISSFTTPVA